MRVFSSGRGRIQVNSNLVAHSDAMVLLGLELDRDAAFEAAPEGAVYVILRDRSTTCGRVGRPN
jgi:hypothetical protein